MWDSHSCDAIYGSVLDCRVRDFGSGRFRSVLGECGETKNLPGRKTDVQEGQWLMKLHTYGLLRNSFRPSPEIRMLRTCWRQRQDLVRSAGRHIQRMQKALRR